MLSWLYQLLMSFVARVLSWIGVSFGAKEVSDVADAVQALQQGGKSDEPQEVQQDVEAYSGNPHPPALLP